MSRYDVTIKMTMTFVRAVEAESAVEAQAVALQDSSDAVRVETEIDVEVGAGS